MTFVRTLIGAAAVAVLAVPSAARAQTTMGGDGVLVPEPATTTCQYNLGSGYACISTTGNLVSWKSTSGAELMTSAIDSYDLCDPSGSRATWGFGDSGWGAPVLLAQTPSMVSIQRTSTDGAYVLVQTWTADKTERDVTVQAKITNISGVSRSGILYVRSPVFAQTSVMYDKSANGVWQRNGLALTSTSIPPDNTAVHPTDVSTGGFFISGCGTAGALSTPGGPSSGDVAQVIHYNVGTLAAGKAKIIKFVYRQQ